METPPPLELLTRFERNAVRLARAMNGGRWQRLWFWCSRQIGARWIAWLTEPLLVVEGLEHVAATSRDRPLVVAANHRSYFDFYVVMSVLFRRLPGWRAILFPVRGRYFYQRPGGVLANAFVAWWSMYPPFFQTREKSRFDQWALEELVARCREGPGRLVGYHPEGTRNRDPDPYSLLPPHAGIGRLILDARPQVVPVFIAGLGNSLGDIVARRFRGGEQIRVRFGPPFEPDGAAAFHDARAPREIAERVMAEIARLGEADRVARRAIAAEGASSKALA